MKKSLQERLDALRKQREGFVTKMQSIFEKASAEDRGFDDAEQKEFDDCKADISTIDKDIENINVLARASLVPATGVPASTKGTDSDDETVQHVDVQRASGGAVDIGGAGVVGVSRRLPKGTSFTRYAMALASSKGNVMAAAEIARQRWSRSTPEIETILRAAVAAGTTTDTTWAAPLAPYQDMQSEFIELLRPMTIMGQIEGQLRRIPFNIRMPRQTSGASAGWVGQGAPKPMSKLGFDSVTMPHSKVAVIVAITEELARMSTPSAEATVRQDLLETVSQFMDVQFIDPTIAAVADVSPGAITNGIAAVNATGGTVAQVTTDLNAALTAMATANIPMRSPVWVMHTRAKNYLMTLRTAQDVFAFRDEMRQGQLLGLPFIASNNVPLRDQNAGGGTEGYIVLMDASEIFLADDGETMLDVSREASLQMVDNPSAGAQSMVSLWQNNLVGIRAERYVHWKRRRDAAVYVTDLVTY